MPSRYSAKTLHRVAASHRHNEAIAEAEGKQAPCGSKPKGFVADPIFKKPLALRSDPDAEKHPEAVAMVFKAFESFVPKNEKAEAERFIQKYQKYDSSAPRADSPDNILRGLSQIELLIESLDEESTACGLTTDLIRNAVLYPASSAKFQIADTAHSTLYVNVISEFFKSTDLCVTHISVKAYSAQWVTLHFSHREAFAEVDLWHQSMIVTTHRAEHAHHVTESIEELVKLFVTAWNLDNKDEK